MSSRLSDLSPQKKALFERLLKEQGVQQVAAERIPRRESVGPAPLSFAQTGLWFLEQYQAGEGTPAYNECGAIHLAGPLNPVALEQALSELISRHEILRTTFSETDGVPTQVVGPPVAVLLPVIDRETVPLGGRLAALDLMAKQAAREPLDFGRGPLVHFQLVRFAKEAHTLLLTLHHIVHDGWSFEVILRELAVGYAAFCQGKQPSLPELPIQYADFAQWQRTWFSGQVAEQQRTYWKKQLGGSLPALELPTDRPRPATPSYRGAHERISLPRSLVNPLRVLGQGEKATQFMVLFAAFVALLHRYTGQTDIVVGTPNANRNRKELEGMVGFVLNTLVLRTDASADPTFRQLLRKVREASLAADAHQDMPFEKLVEALQPRRDPSRNPLFQVLFAAQRPLPAQQAAGVTFSTESLDTGAAKFDLDVIIEEQSDADDLVVLLGYATDLFDASTAARMALHYRSLLEEIAAAPDRRISALSMLTAPERQQLLVGWNGSPLDYPAAGCLHPLIEEQVDRTPDAVAAIFGGESLTYRELDVRANQEANYLVSIGVGPDEPVGICMPRSLEMLVSVLAIMKAGGAYVPLDADHPPDRLVAILEELKPKVVISAGRFELPPEAPPTQWVRLELVREGIAACSATRPRSGVSPDHLLHVIFTSGSTGRPKGVCMTHRPMVNLFGWQRRNLHEREGTRTMQFTTLGFDVAIQEIASALMTGGMIVLCPDELPRAIDELPQFLVEQRIERLYVSPVTLAQLAETCVVHGRPLPRFLREVVTAGEQLRITPAIAELFTRLPECALWNQYGATETHTVLFHRLEGPPSDWPHLPPLGRQLYNTRLYVLGPSGQPVPVGVSGELFIGGPRGIGRGYLGRPDLTAERFLPDPFATSPGARMYWTGDCVRWRPDGTLEFLGRVDSQVKIRGLRIELGEIVTTLEAHPGVREAVVIADREGIDRRLVAYVVPASSFPPTSFELRDHLRRKLPDYMIPAVFVTLQALPLTAGGKIDRRSLPAPDTDRPDLAQPFVAPRTVAEDWVAKVWVEVLGVERVGVDDDFFELGGHSLRATQLVSRIRERLRVELPLRSLFQRPTVAGIVDELAARAGGKDALEEIALAVREVEGLSDEEVSRLLEQG